MTLRGITFTVLAALSAVPGPRFAGAQQEDPGARGALDVAFAALAAISDEDPIGLTDLMVEGAIVVSIPAGGGTPRVTTRDESRARAMTSDFVERGFDPEVVVDGAVATVWLPYDFYRDGEWSHCGVDVFTLTRTDAGWRIASLVYTVEQPPACRPHPEGKPG